MRRRRYQWQRVIVCAVACAVAASAAPAAPAGKDPLAETQAERDKRMQWWREARFGMFIHWGLYAVLAGEYRGKRVGGIGEWIMARAKIPVPEYEKLVPQFNPVKFDAEAWAKVAKDAGMRYMVITSKHHDGFCLWHSKLTEYDIAATPFKRDVLKELAAACEKEGIHFGFYHSIMDWHHPEQKGNFPAYEKHLRGQVSELLTGYGPIGVMWFDGEWIGQWNREKGRSLLALCRGLQPHVVVNNRVGKRKPDDGDYGTPEQKIPATGIPGHDWETCMTMNRTWGFKHYDHSWKSTAVLLRNLIDIASKGGNFLLNVGPTPEGEIPAPSVERLREMGQWLSVNGTGIYGTTASPFRKFAWGRCTKRPGKLYFHVFNWPKDGKLVLPPFGNVVKKAYLLASSKDLATEREAATVTVSVPAEAPDPIATVVVVEVEGEVEPRAHVIRQAADGSLTLQAAEAKLHGGTIRFEDAKNCVGYWTEAGDSVSWAFQLDKAGTFDVALTYACEKGSGGSSFAVAAGGQRLEGTVASTGAWTAFETVKLGSLAIAKPGKHTLTLKASRKPGMAVMNLRSIVLKPTE